MLNMTPAVPPTVPTGQSPHHGSGNGLTSTATALEDTLRLAPLDRDPFRLEVYEAEDEWSMGEWSFGWCDHDMGDLSPDAVAGYMKEALVAAGFGASAAPIVQFDLAGPGAMSGVHTVDDRVIHLHPDVLRHGLLLHELAHWIDPRDGHGPMFQGNLVTLVDAVLGQEPATDLLDAYRHHGLEPDQWRLPDWANQ